MALLFGILSGVRSLSEAPPSVTSLRNPIIPVYHVTPSSSSCVHDIFVKGKNSQYGFRPSGVSSYFLTRKFPVRLTDGLGLMWSGGV
jgi:hypothetical protein